MLEKLVVLIFNTASLWETTNDPWLDEINRYQRRIVALVTMALLFLAVGIVNAPEDGPVSGLAVITGMIHHYISLGAMIGLSVCVLLSLVDIFRLWRAYRDFGVD